MSCHQITMEQLRAAGCRMTPQRALVAEALHHLGGHVTADRVLAHVQMQHPYMDLSTVYRTLERFAELGLVRAFRGAGGPAQFELAEEPHHHLVCTRCGDVQALPVAALDDLMAQLDVDHGFRAEMHHLAIPGLCAACQVGG
jgi:Fur family ferric uptake transcriptional regulator